MAQSHKNFIQYGLFGVSFGFCFPVIAILADILLFKRLALSWQSVGAVHGQNPLHFIIDTAPFFLGMAFSFVGYKQDQLAYVHRSLRKTFDEVLRQKEEILLQRNLLNERNVLIERKSHDLNASIEYAQTIQNAILPDLRLMQQYLPNLLILHKARDVVSGDFYYFNHREGKSFWAVADCTGHGIPASFMTLIGYQHLNNIILQRRIFEPHTVLECLHEGIYSTLRQGDTRNRDGMDIGLCVIVHETREIQFAGSKIPLYYMQEGALVKVAANRTPIGGDGYARHPYETQMIRLPASPTQLYMFTDGYQDQFGGKENKRFLSSRLKVILAQLQGLPAHEQKTSLWRTLEQWIDEGAKEQTDDILLIGCAL